MTIDLTPTLAPMFWAMTALLVAATAAIVLGARLG